MRHDMTVSESWEIRASDMCKYFSSLEDIHGDIVLVFCSHQDNPDKFEGNCTHDNCPLTSTEIG